MIPIFRCLAMAILCTTSPCPAAERPSVLLITSGAQGPGELSAAGHPRLKTPHLDRLTEQGTAFGRMIGAPTPVAGKTQTLTGRHEFACGVSHSLAGRNLPHPERPMLAWVFRKAGYRTAFIGAWGLGEALPCRPEDRGFLEVCASGGPQPGSLADRWGNDPAAAWLRGADGWTRKTEPLAQAWLSEARRFLSQRGADRTPFFLMLDLGGVTAGGKPHDGTREKQLETLDTALGGVLAALDEEALAASTVVLFTGLCGPPAGAWNAGLKGASGSVDEGGVRVPAAIRWPGKIEAGRKCLPPASLMDWFPTLTALCGVNPTGEAAADSDGVNLAPFLLGNSAFPERPPFFSHAGGWPGDDRPERHQAAGFAVRRDNWLLSGLELFDLGADPGQTENQFAAHSDTATSLLAAYGKWWAGVLPGLRLPTRLAVGDPRQPITLLSAADWWPSREKLEIAGAAELASQADARAVLENLAAGRPTPEFSGLWKLSVAREGHYSITASLLPPEAPATEITRLGQLKAGHIHLRTGRKEVVMETVKGATAVTLNLDLPAGDLDLEIWFDGQIPGPDAMTGALFARIERTGERKLPEFDLDLRTTREKP